MKIVRALKLVGAAVALAAVVAACGNASPSPTVAPTVAPTVVVPGTSAPASTAAPSSS